MRPGEIVTATWPGIGRATLPKHAAAYALEHALPAAALRAAGIRHLDEAEVTSIVGKLDDGTTSDGLAIPDGQGAGVVRHLKDGAKPKFKVPPKWKPRMFRGAFPLGRRLTWARVMRDPRVKLFWCEGPLKSLCLTWRGVPAIAFNGLDCWSHEHAPIEDFDLFIWKGRVVVLLVDSDVVAKVEARRSIQRQADHLRSLGAEVRVVIIPSSNGAKVDVNDYVAAHGVDALLTLPETTLPADWTAHDATRELNARLIMVDDGTAEIITIHDDLDHPGTKFVTLSQARNLAIEYRNEQVVVGLNKKGDPIFKTKFDVWLGDPHRREASRLWLRPGAPWGLDPGTREFNLWAGWAFTPREPDAKHHWRRLQDHIAEVIADGDATITKYVLGWLAHGTQFPATPPKVALVLMGGEGVGKGTLAQAFGRLFGRHFVHLERPGQLTERFNERMKDKILIFADENFFAGDHTTASALKTMITEERMTVEAKFANQYTLPNFRKFIIASNETWVIPAGPDARRYAVLRVSERRKGNHPYFSAIFDELARGGYAAMLFDLLHRDLTGFDPWKFPQTRALLDQKRLTWDAITTWWFGKLVAGTFGTSKDELWEARVWASAIRHEIDQSLGSRFERPRAFETAIGMQLRKLCPQVKHERRTTEVGKREWAYEFPSLATCRKEFERFTRTPIDWKTGDLKRESAP